MPSLDMSGPYELTTKSVTKEVESGKKGNYALGKLKGGDFTVKYVGRSDTDLRTRLQQHVGESYTHFEYSYASSDRAAFRKECENYHDFNNLDNANHPDRPNGMDWKCPKCGIFG